MESRVLGGSGLTGQPVRVSSSKRKQKTEEAEETESRKGRKNEDHTQAAEEVRREGSGDKDIVVDFVRSRYRQVMVGKGGAPERC